MKNDKDGKPLRAKSRIVVLGNFEDRLYQKSQRYAPVLKYSSLRLLTAKAVGNKRILQQGDCKNAFCNTTLPDNEVTVIRPPIGDEVYEKISKNQYLSLRRAGKIPKATPSMCVLVVKNEKYGKLLRAKP